MTLTIEQFDNFVGVYAKLRSNLDIALVQVGEITILLTNRHSTEVAKQLTALGFSRAGAWCNVVTEAFMMVGTPEQALAVLTNRPQAMSA